MTTPKPTTEGQRNLAKEARDLAERLKTIDPATSAFFLKVARAHEAEAKRIAR